MSHRAGFFSVNGRSAVAWLLLVLSVACGDSKGTPTQPTSPPPTSPGSGENPVVKFEVKGDELGSRDPIAMLSEVSVDASASTGAGTLTYTIDFGDGTKSPGPAARHTFQAAGTYTISVEARDAQGRQGTATQQLVVKTVSGGWYHAAYNPNAKMVEVRRLTITGQQGLTVQGVFAVNGQPDRTFSATLTKPRSVQIVVNSAISLEGVIPSRLNDDSGTWPLQMRGETVDGQRLEFRAAIGDQSSSAPDAVLRTPTERGHPFVFAGVPAEFDGSSSQGTGLSHFIDFGDGQAVPQSRVVQALGPGWQQLELTVVDSLGRYNREKVGFIAQGLYGQVLDYWRVPSGGPIDVFYLRFDKFDGQRYTGIAHRGYTAEPFASAVGTIGPNREVRIVLSNGVEYRGVIAARAPDGVSGVALTLTQFGGASNGVTFTMLLSNPY